MVYVVLAHTHDHVTLTLWPQMTPAGVMVFHTYFLCHSDHIVVCLSVCLSDLYTLTLSVSVQGVVFMFGTYTPWAQHSQMDIYHFVTFDHPRGSMLFHKHIVFMFEDYSSKSLYIYSKQWLVYKNCCQQSLIETYWNVQCLFFFSLCSAWYCSETRSEAAFCDRNTYPLCIHDRRLYKK